MHKNTACRLFANGLKLSAIPVYLCAAASITFLYIEHREAMREVGQARKALRGGTNGVESAEKRQQFNACHIQVSQDANFHTDYDKI